MIINYLASLIAWGYDRKCMKNTDWHVFCTN